MKDATTDLHYEINYVPYINHNFMQLKQQLSPLWPPGQTSPPSQPRAEQTLPTFTFAVHLKVPKLPCHPSDPQLQGILVTLQPCQLKEGGFWPSIAVPMITSREVRWHAAPGKKLRYVPLKCPFLHFETTVDGK